jgi:hypothetical protein
VVVYLQAIIAVLLANFALALVQGGNPAPVAIREKPFRPRRRGGS